MKDEWSTIEKIFHAAGEVHGEARSKYLDEACGSNKTMRRKVEALLDHDKSEKTFLDQSAAELVRVTLVPGTAIGHYEIIDIAGIGGMGQVYRARDTRLKRTVAIKTLPVFTHDSKRLAQFEQEATLLASLNHPNIGCIYDVIEIDDAPYLVLEYVEGPTLAERLKSGPVPVGEVLQIAQQIASALETAHEKGIVHRDLKPSNIKIGIDRRVKVLDFGLAKMFAETDTVAGVLLNPAENLSESDRSLFRGTPSYMSPEQMQGGVVDKRSDVWAFGCILYELLTGRKAFGKEDTPDTLESILKRKPDWSLLPRQTPAGLVSLLRQCLEKNPARRLESAGDLTRMIGGIHTIRQRKHWASIAAAILIVMATMVGFHAILSFRSPGNLHIADAHQITFDPDLELDQALSPDNQWLAYTGGIPDNMHIYVRRMSDGSVRNITQDLGSNYNRWPRWNPDGKSLAFVSDNRSSSDFRPFPIGHTIWRIPYTGGSPQFVVESDSLGHTWSPDGKKLAYFRDGYLSVVSVDNGFSEKLVEAPKGHSPSWSPDGKWIAYVSRNMTMLFEPFILGNIATSGIVIVNASTGERHPLTDTVSSNSSPVWMPDSRSILFISNSGSIRDVFELRLSDKGNALGEPVRITADLDALTIDVSRNGQLLTYSKFLLKSNLVSIPIPEDEIVSASNAAHLTSGTQTIEGFHASRDGKWILYDSNRSGNQDVYKMPASGEPEVQLTRNPYDDFLPVWSPDRQEIAFYSFRNGNRDIYVMSADGADEKQVTHDPDEDRYPDWSPDGKNLVFYSDRTGQEELFIISRENGNWGQTVQLTSSELGAYFPRWSPDGKTIVYCDELKGVCLISPDGNNSRVLVPKQPNFLPKFVAWSSDSKNVYFRAGNNRRFWSIYSVPADRGEFKMLVRFEEFTRHEFVASDKDFFFTLHAHESDIWLLHLER